MPQSLKGKGEEVLREAWNAWMSRWKLGSMVRISGLFHPNIPHLQVGYNPLILTIDPNFLGHASGGNPVFSQKLPWLLKARDLGFFGTRGVHEKLSNITVCLYKGIIIFLDLFFLREGIQTWCQNAWQFFGVIFAKSKTQVIQFVTFLSPIVGSHLAISKAWKTSCC